MPKPKKGKKSGSGGDASHEMDPDWHKVCAVCDRCVLYCAFAANVQEIVCMARRSTELFAGFLL
jgi:heterodisulfide reductase subunit C